MRAKNPSLPIVLCMAAFMPAIPVHAQERTAFKPVHEVGLAIGHAYSFSGINDKGEKVVSALPYWGLDYNFQFAPKFAVGLHVDFISESFKVEKNLSDEHETIERSFPIAPAAMGFYKPTERWSFGLGMGAEFSKEENYILNRAAVEYSVYIRKAWYVFGVVQYDFRWNAYDTWTIGLGISKAFGARKD